MRPLKATATCRATPRGISIDLWVDGFRRRLVVIELAFGDIDELRTFTYIEAASLAGLGPEKNDLHDYFRGRVERPHMLHIVHSIGTTLLIRGRDLFYLITVDRAGLYDVIEAYAAAKSRAPLPPHGAAAPPSPSPRSDASAR